MLLNEHLKVLGLSKSKGSKAENRKYYFGTWNNPAEDWRKIADSFAALYCICQLEEGKNKVPHIQFMVYYKTGKSMADWKGSACWVTSVAEKHAVRVANYCRKEDSRIEGPYEYGTLPQSTTLRKLRDWSDSLRLAKEGKWLDIEADILIPYLPNLQKLSAYFTKPVLMATTRGLWFFGAPGTGKSFTARSEFLDAYIKGLNKWWDNYAGEKYVILDDLDKLGSCLGHHLKIWTDMYACRGEIKHGSVALLHEVFVVTSNYVPEDLWPDDPVLCVAIRRRFVFRDFGYRAYAPPSEEVPVNYFDDFIKYNL